MKKKKTYNKIKAKRKVMRGGDFTHQIERGKWGWNNNSPYKYWYEL